MLTFNAVKVEHKCKGGFGDIPNPGEGNCGSYQDLKMGEKYSGSIMFSGGFLEISEGTYAAEINGVNMKCTFGFRKCATGIFDDSFGWGNSSLKSLISASTIITSYDAYYEIDLNTGTGFHEWVDDDYPTWGRGSFEFSNARVSGFPIPPSVPLPASAPLLLGAIGLTSTGRRWRRSG